MDCILQRKGRRKPLRRQAEEAGLSLSNRTATAQSDTHSPSVLRQQAGLILLIALSLALSVSIAFHSTNPYATLESQYTDHLRHQRYAEEFLRRGLDIYSEPAGKLQRLIGEDDRTYIWPDVSYPYPLGALLVHLPAGVLRYQLGMDPLLVNRALILLYLAFGHLCAYLYVRAYMGQQKWGGYFIGLWVVGLFWLSMVLWSLNGQFESLPLLLVLLASLSYQRGRYDTALALVGGALLLKYQAILFAPLVLDMFWRQTGGRLQMALSRGIAILAGAVALDIVTTALSYRYVQMPDANLISYTSLLSTPLFPAAAPLLAALALTVSLAAYLMRRRQAALALNVMLTIPFLALLPQVQGWYLLWLFPLALFAAPAERDAVGFWALGLAYLIRQLPDPSFLSVLVLPRLP